MNGIWYLEHLAIPLFVCEKYLLKKMEHVYVNINVIISSSSGGWGYRPRYEELARVIKAKVPQAEVTGFVGRSSKWLLDIVVIAMNIIFAFLLYIVIWSHSILGHIFTISFGCD